MILFSNSLFLFRTLFIYHYVLCYYNIYNVIYKYSHSSHEEFINSLCLLTISCFECEYKKIQNIQNIIL